LWSDREPLHDRVLIGRGGGPAFDDTVPREIVGIVRDVPQNGLNHRPAAGMYVPIAQLSDQLMAYFSQLGLVATWAVRTRSAPAPFVGPIGQALLQSTQLPIARILTMEDVVETVTAPTALNMWMMTVFAIVAVVLAVIGLYAIAAYSVEQRKHELGIRLALGADPARLRNGVMADAMRWVCVGIAIGMTSAAAAGGTLRAFLFGVTLHDPATYVAVSVLLSAASLAGAYIPGRRAARLDPLAALRSE
jgi:predicted lysophospholipase L1 biosynthesis ABC-type transport system permease subunit